MASRTRVPSGVGDAAPVSRLPIRRRVGVTAAGAASSIVLLGAVTVGGLATAGHRFLGFYSGVFALLALSGVVVLGLVASHRGILLARHRVALQVTHQVLAAIAATFLTLHIVLKVVDGQVRLVDTVVPFLATHRPIMVGLGTLALYLIVVVIGTGFLRFWFAHSRRPSSWRVIHAVAYPAWLLTIVHGLGAGRRPATWVTVSYIGCVAAVCVGILVRFGVNRGRRGKDAG